MMLKDDVEMKMENVEKQSGGGEENVKRGGILNISSVCRHNIIVNSGSKL